MRRSGRVAETLVLDTSVLLNFLVVNRIALLSAVANRLIVTDHVRAEITEDYPQQVLRYEHAIGQRLLKVVSVSDPAELEAFASLLRHRVLGVGECSAIAYAGIRGHAVALDDKVGRSRARTAFPQLPIVGTKDIVIAAIVGGAITLEEADALKVDWEQNHRFRFRFATFSDVLPAQAD